MSEDIFFKRRSVRSFILDKAIPNEDIEYILKAAMYAPSANNSRSWEFIVVKERDTIIKMSEVHQYAKPLATSSVSILVCANMRTSGNGINKFWEQNASAAIENILLAATYRNIGSLWMGIAPLEEYMIKLSEMFGLPEHINPVAMIALGYAKTDFDMSKRASRFEQEKIHYEKY